MPHFLYVSLQDDNKILVFAIDAETGGLTPQAEVPVAGGPAVLAIGNDRRVLYVGHRGEPRISSFRIDRRSGGLALEGAVAPSHPPTFLAPDRSGRYLLSAYYQGGFAAVHPVAADGAVGAEPLERVATAAGAHAIATDPSNRFAFVPHIARLNDNVLEPPREDPGPNMILQFRFDASSGRLSANTPFRIEPAGRLGPRHFSFHPTRDLVYFSNEQGSSVTLYRLDAATGTLAAEQTIATLPDGWGLRNTCSQIHLVPIGAFPLCRQPRSQQHCRVCRRRRHRAFDRRRPRRDRGGPERLWPRPGGPVRLCRRLGLGASCRIPHRRRHRGADGVGELRRRPAADGGAGGAAWRLEESAMTRDFIGYGADRPLPAGPAAPASPSTSSSISRRARNSPIRPATASPRAS